MQENLPKIPPQAKCTRCRQRAVVALPSHNSRFCTPCFLHFFRTAVTMGIKKAGPEKDTPLIMAVSGGKDSLTAWTHARRPGVSNQGPAFQPREGRAIRAWPLGTTWMTRPAGCWATWWATGRNLSSTNTPISRRPIRQFWLGLTPCTGWKSRKFANTAASRTSARYKAAVRIQPGPPAIISGRHLNTWREKCPAPSGACFLTTCASPRN